MIRTRCSAARAALLVGLVLFGGRAAAGEADGVWPGLDRAAELAGRRAALPVTPLPAEREVTSPGMSAGPAEGARRERDLAEGWSQVAVEAGGRLGAAKAIKLPAPLQPSANSHALWYVLRTNLKRSPGERLVVRFQRVSMFCVMFVNGKECGRHLGAYTPFEFDVTDAVGDGDSFLALYVHDRTGAEDGRKAFNQMGSDKAPTRRELDNFWTAGAPVLERRKAAYVRDVFVKTSTRNGATELVAEVVNALKRPASARLSFEVRRWPDGATEQLTIPAQSLDLPAGGARTVTMKVPWPDPRLWSPEHPNLYVLESTLAANGASDTLQTRFGFREFWVEGKQFMLNGSPIRLRGQSFCGLVHMPEARDRDLCREYFRRQKEQYDVNACRVHARIGDAAIYQAADEIGVLLIDQSSIWSNMGSRYDQGGDLFVENTRREFGEWVRRDRNCPSVVVWDVENEMIRAQRNEKRTSWVMKLDGFVKAHDDTRPVEHSGAGWYDPGQQIVHIHMQENYTRLLDEWAKRGTGPLVMGEFWIGGTGAERRLTSGAEVHSAGQVREEYGRLFEERMLEMRYYGASGVMPFTGGEPERFRHGLQPATVFFWPRGAAVEAGGTVGRELVVCNDREGPAEFDVRWQSGREHVRLGPAAQWRKTVEVKADGEFVAELTERGKVISSDRLPVRVIAADRLAAPKLGRRVVVYQGRTECASPLGEMGVRADAAPGVPDHPENAIWVIGPGASDAALDRQAEGIRLFLQAGGRILCLPQDHWPRWAPVRLPFWSAVREPPTAYVAFGWPEKDKDMYFSRYAPIYAAGHPAFEGLGAEDLRWWSAYDGRVSDDAIIRPAAVGVRSQGAWRILAGACRPENGSLAEARVGRGLIVFCQLQVLRQRQNPEARAVLMNLLRYLDGPGWPARRAAVRLGGKLSAEKIGRQTGAPAQDLNAAGPEDGGVLIAGDGASAAELQSWADRGGTAVVLSAETAARLSGFAVRKGDGVTASRGADEPLLWGVASGSFGDADRSPAAGVLKSYPGGAAVLLHGADGEGPVAVRLPHGRGKWIVTTLEPWRGRSAYDDELMSLLLANAGVNIPPTAGQAVVRAFRTAPPVIDGRLDDWTNDMEDRNVSKYRHAEPLVLSSRDGVPQAPGGDAQLSTVLYFLWDDRAAYLAGAVFGSEADGAKITFRLNEKEITVGPVGPGAKARLGTVDLDAAGGELPPEKLVDARVLDFGSPQPAARQRGPAPEVAGRTFEVRVPWAHLGEAKAPERADLLVTLQGGGGARLQTPAAAGLLIAP